MKPFLLNIAFAVPIEAEVEVAALFERVFGVAPVLYTDEETLVTDVGVYLTDPGAWTSTRQQQLDAGLARLRQTGLPLGRRRLRVRRLRNEDWAESWKRHFRPFEVGAALLVKPTWSRRTPRAGQAVVFIDPGLSFGTGQHPTTRFCLEQIVAARRSSSAPSLLDVGTGSGILAIAALQLGYRPVAAFDFDPAAVRVARANARLNNVGAALRPVRQDLRRLPREPGRRYTVVCANLLDDLLRAERDRIVARLAPRGRLVLAGILDRQFPAVRAAYESAGLRLVADKAAGEWRSGAFVTPD
jgi:ribosomal protein L11 methyltransferase